MSEIHIQRLNKTYAGVRVLSDIDLHIRQGEFIAILGPSGCGKTTLLRMIAGFEQPDSGTISIGGKVVTSNKTTIAPEDRNLGIVFQNYALWPHMSVAENVGYSLKVRKVPLAERSKRIDAALNTVEMLHLAHRKPADLSGGQRQRVALARCLAQGNNLVLLDEPLANLDVNLRSAMEDEFSKFHRSSGASLFYITHDQAEAMALADRVAVMDKGVIVQFSTPQSLYNEPQNAMVANFIGDGFTLATGHVGNISDGQATVKIEGFDVRVRCHPGELSRPSGVIALHPEHLTAADEGQGHVRAKIKRKVFRGSHFRVEAEAIRYPGVQLAFYADNAKALDVGQTISLTINDAWLIPTSPSH